MNLNDNERKVLAALYKSGLCYDEFCYLSFNGLVLATPLDRATIRRACRSLARKGLAVYGKGLCRESGEFAGAGYAITKAGSALCRVVEVVEVIA